MAPKRQIRSELIPYGWVAAVSTQGADAWLGVDNLLKPPSLRTKLSANAGCHAGDCAEAHADLEFLRADVPGLFLRLPYADRFRDDRADRPAGDPAAKPALRGIVRLLRQWITS